MFTGRQKRSRLSEVSLLDELGFLNSRLVAAHCISLSDDDMRVLAKRGANVIYCPVGNLKLGSGVARIRDLIESGGNVAFGTDGPASNNCLDMFETMKTGALIQKVANNDPSAMGAYEVLKMATLNGGQALGIGRSVGSLAVGKKADVVLVDMRKPHLSPLHSVFAGLVYSARGSDVDTVIVDRKCS
jgi:5-methylthioadenosine/S-adenosylhomocysteine deaminase